MVKSPKCRVCGTEDKDSFYIGRKNICKTCYQESNNKTYYENKEKLQELLEKTKTKTPKVTAPIRNNEKIIEDQNIKITLLETQILELNDKILNLYNLLEKKEEVQSVKIVSPVKCELPLPLPIVQEKVKVTHKVKTPVKRSTKEKEEIKENIENLNSKTVKELTELAKKYGLPVPLNRRGKEDRIEDLKKFLS